MRRLGFVILLSVAVLAGEASGQTDAIETMVPQGSSVGNGASSKRPTFASDVRKAAKAAQCALKGFPGSRSGTRGQGIRYSASPAVAGRHDARWADWGFYDKPIPPRYAVHNLRRGGVMVSLGNGGLPNTQAQRLVDFFAAEPGFLLIAPRHSKGVTPRSTRRRAFPERGFIVTSWQRRMVCRRATTRSMRALEAYARRYRGTGPQQMPPVNSPLRRPAQLPAAQSPGHAGTAIEGNG